MAVLMDGRILIAMSPISMTCQDEMEQKEAEKLSKSKNEVGTHSSLVYNGATKKDRTLLRVKGGVGQQNLDKNEPKMRLVLLMVAMVGPTCRNGFACSSSPLLIGVWIFWLDS